MMGGMPVGAAGARRSFSTAAWSQPLRAALWPMQRDLARARLGWALALLLLLAAGLLTGGAQRVMSWAALVLVWLGASLLQDLRRQNQPQAARLVPGQLRALRLATVGVVLGVAMAAGVVMGLARGQPVAWALTAALVLLVFGAGLRWWGHWVLLGLVGATAFWWSDTAAWGAASAALRAWHAEQPLSLALWGLLAVAGLASRLPARAGLPLRQAPGGLADALGVAVMHPQGAPVPGALGRLGWALGAAFSFGLPLWRAWLLRRARPTAGSVLARVELALYGPAHVSALLSTGLVVATLLAGLFSALLALTPLSWELLRREGAMGLSIGIAALCFNPLLSLPQTLQQTRREQAVLALLPGLPRGAALNRALARRQMQQMALSATVALLLPWALLGRPGLEAAALLVAALLPLSVSLWRDNARLAAPGPAHLMRLVVAGLVWLLLLAALREPMGGSPWALLALGIGLWVVLMVWRWRALQGWPAMLPVAR